MSTQLRYVGASDRAVQITAEFHAHSSLDVVLVLKRVAPITRPVDLARKLKAFGLRLQDAHRALDRIVADEAVSLTLSHADRATMVAELAKLGVEAR